MLFSKKKKLPFLKIHLDKKGDEVVNNATNPVAVFFTEFLFILVHKPRLGNSKKEKKVLYNDVAIFELIVFSFSKIVKYLLNVYPHLKLPMIEIILLNKKRLESQMLFEGKPLSDLKYKHKDFLTFNINFIEYFHKEYKNWEDSLVMINERMNLYLTNAENQEYCNSIFHSLIINSTKVNKPIRLSDLNNFNKAIGSDDFLKFTINIMAFESTMLKLVFDRIDDFFENNQEYGFRINNEW
jgi:hypothetical protein